MKDRAAPGENQGKPGKQNGRYACARCARKRSDPCVLDRHGRDAVLDRELRQDPLFINQADGPILPDNDPVGVGIEGIARRRSRLLEPVRLAPIQAVAECLPLTIRSHDGTLNTPLQPRKLVTLRDGRKVDDFDGGLDSARRTDSGRTAAASAFF